MTAQSGDRRSQVMLGPLPDGFLQAPQHQQQVSADAQTAAYMQYGSGGYVPGNFLPPNIRGKLSITVVQAKLNKNYGLMKMDTYCRIRLGHHVLETPTAHGAGKTPSWNKSITCYLPEGVESMYMEVYDERTFTTDNRVAWANIQFPAEVFTGEMTDKWYTLSGQQGEDKEGAVHIVMSVSDVWQLPRPAPLMVGGGMPAMPLMYQVVPPGGYASASQYPAAGQQQQLQQPVPQEVVISEADVTQIQELFPAVEGDVIRSVLEANRGDKDGTINSLLQMQAD